MILSVPDNKEVLSLGKTRSVERLKAHLKSDYRTLMIYTLVHELKKRKKASKTHSADLRGMIPWLTSSSRVRLC